MSNEKVVERAAEVIAAACGCGDPVHPKHAKQAAALNAANLLASDLHREALGYCERYALWWDRGTDQSPAASDLARVGRASLAAKAAAKGPRWVAEQRPGLPGRWSVQDTRGKCENLATTPRCGNLYTSAEDLTEAQAKAVAEALNRLAADEGQVRP